MDFQHLQNFAKLLNKNHNKTTNKQTQPTKGNPIQTKANAQTKALSAPTTFRYENQSKILIARDISHFFLVGCIFIGRGKGMKERCQSLNNMSSLSYVKVLQESNT